MKRMRPLVVALAAATLAACAQSPQAAGPTPSPAPAPSPAATPAPAPAPQPTSAVGVYDFSLSAEGQEVQGTVTITQDGDRYGGTIETSATPTIPISSVAVEGQVVTVSASSPDGEAVLTFRMNGLDFTGSWAYGGMSGPLQGRKRG